jgi:hypothetical protein
VNDPIAHAAALLGRHRAEVGFVLRKSLERASARDELFTTHASAAYVWHRRDGQTTLHAIVSEEAGHGSRLLQLIVSDSRARGQTSLLARCPEGLAANDWYARRDFVLARVEPGKLRPLNVWVLVP